jgi:hypothetical protein
MDSGGLARELGSRSECSNVTPSKYGGPVRLRLSRAENGVLHNGEGLKC